MSPPAWEMLLFFAAGRRLFASLFFIIMIVHARCYVWWRSCSFLVLSWLEVALIVCRSLIYPHFGISPFLKNSHAVVLNRQKTNWTRLNERESSSQLKFCFFHSSSNNNVNGIILDELYHSILVLWIRKVSIIPVFNLFAGIKSQIHTAIHASFDWVSTVL